jgi:small-conductance mechanosensitive channel
VFRLNTFILGNTVLRWLIAFGTVAAILAVTRLLRDWLRSRQAARPVRPFSPAGLLSHFHFLSALALALACASLFLEFPPRLTRYLDLLLPMALVGQLAAWLHRGIGLWVEHRFSPVLEPPAGGEAVDPARAASAAGGASRAAVLGFLMRLVLWSLVMLLALEAFGFNVSTLLASLGIGGIAVALAVQNILGDLFASLSIAMDEPFMVGDFIIVGECVGMVQYIGLKTTRIRSISGEQIVISNSDLLKSRVRNFKKMLERRVVFEFTLAHRTPADRVERIPPMLRGIVEAQPGVRFDRAHFKEFCEGGLKFEVVYFIPDPDFNRYMDIQQAINLGLLRGFGQEEVELGFPNRVLRLDGEGIAGPAQGVKMEP